MPGGQTKLKDALLTPFPYMEIPLPNGTNARESKSTKRTKHALICGVNYSKAVACEKHPG